MSQVDWLMEYSTGLQSNASCVSIVASGDIDAVVIHLFAMSYLWPRTEDGSFKNDVKCHVDIPFMNINDCLLNS